MLTFLTTKYYQKISLNCNNITSFQRKALHTLQVCSFHTLRKMRWTYLIVPTRFIFIKRSMQITKYVVKNHVIPKSHTVLSPLTPKGSTRGMAAIVDPTDSDFIIIIGNFTSAGDGTIVLTEEQPDLAESENDSDIPSFKDKEQRFLLNKRLIRISKEDFKEKSKGTSYIQGNDKQGFSIVQKIIDNFLQNKTIICKQSLESPREFTLEQLLSAAKSILQKETQQLHDELNKLVVKLSTMDIETRNTYLEKLKNQHNNMLKEIRKKDYYANLTRKDQILYNLYNKLEEIKTRSKAIIKKNKEKLYIESMQAKTKAEKEQYQQEYNNNNLQGD